jgi:UDP-glucose 4-epimerase
MTVFGVTGASGPLGMRLCEALCARGTGSIVGVDAAPPRADLAGLEFRTMDIRDPGLITLWRDAAVRSVIHLAAALDPIRGRREMQSLAVDGTRNVLDAASACGAEQILFLSGATVYGAHPDNPPRLTEKHPLRPNPFPCSADKAEAERLVSEFAAANLQVRVAVLRPAIVIGPHVMDFVARSFQQPLFLLPAGADAELQFLHEDDLVAACLAALDGRRAGTWNLAGRGTMRLSECLARLGTRVISLPPLLLEPALNLSRALRLPFAEAPASVVPFLLHPWLVDPTRAREDLGFTPRHSAAEAFESFLKTFAGYAEEVRERGSHGR